MGNRAGWLLVLLRELINVSQRQLVRRAVKKKTEHFMVRVTMSIDPPPPYVQLFVIFCVLLP